MITSVSIIHHIGTPVGFVIGGLERLSYAVARGFQVEAVLKDERRFIVGVVSTFFVAGYPLFAQTFIPTTAPAQNWVSLTSSADGTYLAAVASYGYLYVSRDSGASWVQVSTTQEGTEPRRPWQAVARSLDGSKLVAVANYSPIFTSSDYGRTWITNGPCKDWAAVASSADGAKIVAVDYDSGGIYTSADYGAHWVLTGAPVHRWRCVASSSDGTRLVAGTDFGAEYGQLPAIYTSTDSGATWQLTSAPKEPWQSISCSADGTKLAAAVFGGPIYLSEDAGTNWRTADVPALRWTAICSSGHGSKLLATSWDGQIYFSADSGDTWTATAAPGAQWQAATCSFDGSQSFAAIWNIWNDTPGGIYAAETVTPVSNETVDAGRLDIQQAGNNVILSWSLVTANGQLQHNSDLSSTNWDDVRIVPRMVNGRNQVVLISQPGSHFFRLLQR